MAFSLTKSLFCEAVQCPRMLWLRLHRPDLFDASVQDEHLFDTGNRVGEAARGLFGPCARVPFGYRSSMAEETRRLLEAGETNIAEASFEQDGLFCSVDILRVLPDGAVEICEVKSGTSVKDIHLWDAAFQMHVLSLCGLRVERVCVVHINSEYVRRGDLDLQQLFAIEDVTDRCLALQENTANTVAFLRTYLAREEEPACPLGEQCFSPYECGFWAHCSEHLPKPNVFDLAGMQLKKKAEFCRQGIVSFADLASQPKLSAAVRQQIDHELRDLPPDIDRDRVRLFLREQRFPLYFLDFESFQPAIPLYEGSRPYEQIPFQYSLHILETEDGPLLHREYLARPGEDPRRELAEQLCRDIPASACVLAYNMSFEKGRIKALAGLYPDLAEHLASIGENIQDLMVPFRSKWVYARAMQGSYSIKYVLPALFPDDPDLDYHSLDNVHNGAEASSAFEAMESMDEAEAEGLRKDLLRYCGLDTLAMVKIRQKLCELAGE